MSLGSKRLVSSVLFALSACAGAAQHAARAERVEGPLDAIVVLGHRPPLGPEGLEYETRARVEQGVALHREGRAPWLLFSGGPSTPEAIEADVMASYATEHGAATAAVLRERASRDTIENARLSVALLREKLGLTRAPRLLLVTSDYHIERASHLFRCAGAEVVPSAVPLRLSKSERARRLRSERWVRFYYHFIDECGRARGS
ncbi:MAG: hypothetical protein JWN48_90 [Myxococcaceae bacterium]|nr:hypothetical protein [Myxococcaceae bacterium]